jgi:hypothetical protein
VEFNIQINNDKSEFLKEGVHYCGYYVDKDNVHKEKSKMETIEKMSRPKNISELHASLGLINYYGRFIRNLSTILTPLHTLLQKKGRKAGTFRWTPECEVVFKVAKKEFTSNKVLAH